MEEEMVLCKDVMLRIYFKLLMIKSYLQFKFSSLFFVHHLLHSFTILMIKINST